VHNPGPGKKLIVNRGQPKEQQAAEKESPEPYAKRGNTKKRQNRSTRFDVWKGGGGERGEVDPRGRDAFSSNGAGRQNLRQNKKKTEKERQEMENP